MLGTQPSGLGQAPGVIAGRPVVSADRHSVINLAQQRIVAVSPAQPGYTIRGVNNWYFSNLVDFGTYNNWLRTQPAGNPTPPGLQVVQAPIATTSVYRVTPGVGPGVTSIFGMPAFSPVGTPTFPVTTVLRPVAIPTFSAPVRAVTAIPTPVRTVTGIATPVSMFPAPVATPTFPVTTVLQPSAPAPVFVRRPITTLPIYGGLRGLTFDGSGLFGSGLFGSDVTTWGIPELIAGAIGAYAMYAMFFQAKQTKYRAEMAAGRRRKSRASKLRAKAKKLEEQTTGFGIF